MGSRAVQSLSLRHCRAFIRFRSSLASHLPSPAFMACRSNPPQEEVSQLITILAAHFQVFSSPWNLEQMCVRERGVTLG